VRIAREYGPRARVGIATPQANPTVEPEMQALLPASIGTYITRLAHPASQVEDRLLHYIRNIPAAIACFGTLRLDALGFGCTGSSYLAGAKLEASLLNEATTACQIPIITAASAICSALNFLGATRIALVSPYPVNLAEAGYRYWHDHGFQLSATLRVDDSLTDTHGIYEMTSDDALDALRQIDCSGADCLLASGTGMPTLRALRKVHSEFAVPVLSSNLCLAWALLKTVAPELVPNSPTELLLR